MDIPTKSPRVGRAESQANRPTNLLVGVGLHLHPGLIQGEVVLEEEEQEMPEDARLLEVVLEVFVHGEGTHALAGFDAQAGQVLEVAKESHESLYKTHLRPLKVVT